MLFRPRSPGTWNYEIGSGTKIRGTSPDRARLKEPEEKEPEAKVEVRTRTVKKTGEQAPGPWFKEPEATSPGTQEEE